VGIFSSLLAAWGILGRLGLFLSLLSIAVGPIGGILVADYYLLGGRHRGGEAGGASPFRDWNPVALVSYGLAVVVGWATSGHPFNLEIFPFSVFAFNGILTSLLFYWAGMKTLGRRKRALARTHGV